MFLAPDAKWLPYYRWDFATLSLSLQKIIWPQKHLVQWCFLVRPTLRVESINLVIESVDFLV